jgi:anthranilate phosphoribosyltransferase
VSVLPSVEHPLDESEAEAAFGAMLDGHPSDEAIAAFLVALSDRGETASEIAGAARAMRARLIPVAAPANAIDVCGTGGDGHHTLNVSTAVALVVAACGVPVAKHGNRAASSKAGAADTLEALGLDLDRAHATAEATLADLGIGFLFAGKHHPAMGRIMPIRRRLGRRTIFNLMGPLANPAGVRRQLVGIARPPTCRSTPRRSPGSAPSARSSSRATRASTSSASPAATRSRRSRAAKCACSASTRSRPAGPRTGRGAARRRSAA